MAQFIQNILWNSVSGFVEAGTRTAGGYAGDALIKAGDMIENGGRSVGNGIERRASTYGSAISGQTYKPSAKPLPSTARKPAIKRSNSTPASSKPTTGATKYSAPAKKALPLSRSTTSSAGSKASTAPKSLPAAKQAQNPLPKPYTSSGNLSYSSPSPTEKKTPVKTGQPKPFIVKEAAPGKEDKLKPYPGTNTLPGQGGKTPVKAKAPPRMKPPAEKGRVQHISF